MKKLATSDSSLDPKITIHITLKTRNETNSRMIVVKNTLNLSVYYHFNLCLFLSNENIWKRYWAERKESQLRKKAKMN